MDENATVSIRPMQVNDIGNCLLLSEAEGWNQTEKDWTRLAGNTKNVCLAAESLNRIIGTATAMNYANDVAWIGMVLVDKEYRGRGISKMLMSGLIDQLGSCRSVKLDATPAGQPVYRKFGFIEEYVIYRMTGLSPKNLKPETSDKILVPVQLKDISDIVLLDQMIFGAERYPLLNSLIKESPEIAWQLKQDDNTTGFALGRRGRKYIQIGPVFTGTYNDAKSLITKALECMPGQPVVVDVLSDKEDLMRWLNSIGFISQRHFVRMYLQKNPLPGLPGKQFLICGPEFG